MHAGGVEIETDGRADVTLSSFQLAAPAVPGQERAAGALVRSVAPFLFDVSCPRVFLLIWVCVEVGS